MASKVCIDRKKPNEHNLNNPQKDKVFFKKENEVEKSGSFEINPEISYVGKALGSSFPEDTS